MNNFEVWIDNDKVNEVSGVEAAYEAYRTALEMAKEDKKSCYLIEKDTALIVMKCEKDEETSTDYTANARTVIDRLFKNKKTSISQDELFRYKDPEAIRTILRNEYNLKYHPCQYIYTFDNPLLEKHKIYILSFCCFDYDRWTICGQVDANDKNAYRICKRVLFLENRKPSEYVLDEDAKRIFDEILSKKIYVGKERYWKINTKEYY